MQLRKIFKCFLLSSHIHFTPFLCVLLNYTINAIIIKEKDYALSIIEKP